MMRADLRVLVCAFAVMGCAPNNIAFSVVTPPRVVSVEPSQVSLQPTLTIAFSEAMNAKTIDTDPTSKTLSIALVPADDVDDAFFSDFAHPPLAKKRAAMATPLRATLAGNTLTITTDRELAPSTSYALVISKRVRSASGVALGDTFVHHIATEDAGPAVSSSNPIANARVAPNRKRFTVTFTKPVRNVAPSMRVSPDVEIESVTLSPDRMTATLKIADALDGCARLLPDAQYALVLESGIVDDTGKHLEHTTIPFDTVSACDTTPNAIGALAHDDGDTFSVLGFDAAKPSTSIAFVRKASDAVARTIVGPTSTAANAHDELRIDALDVDTDYDFVVRVEDDDGFTATAGGTIHTSPLPKIALNEVYADPTTSPEDASEFVEIASFADETLDIAQWSLRIEHDDSEVECVLPPSTSIAPGAFLVVASESFDANAVGLDESALARVSPWCHLANGVALTLKLVDADGRAVSTLHTPKSIAGRSFEKTAPSAPDDASNVCPSRMEIGPTPGRENGVALFGCSE